MEKSNCVQQYEKLKSEAEKLSVECPLYTYDIRLEKKQTAREKARGVTIAKCFTSKSIKARWVRVREDHNTHIFTREWFALEGKGIWVGITKDGYIAINGRGEVYSIYGATVEIERMSDGRDITIKVESDYYWNDKMMELGQAYRKAHPEPEAAEVGTGRSLDNTGNDA